MAQNCPRPRGKEKEPYRRVTKRGYNRRLGKTGGATHDQGSHAREQSWAKLRQQLVCWLYIRLVIESSYHSRSLPSPFLAQPPWIKATCSSVRCAMDKRWYSTHVRSSKIQHNKVPKQIVWVKRTVCLRSLGFVAYMFLCGMSHWQGLVITISSCTSLSLITTHKAYRRQ